MENYGFEEYSWILFLIIFFGSCLLMSISIIILSILNSIKILKNKIKYKSFKAFKAFV